MTLTNDEISRIRSKYRHIIDHAKKATLNNKYQLAIQFYEKLIMCIDVTEYQFIDAIPEISKDIYLDTLFKTSLLYKHCATNKPTTETSKEPIINTNENNKTIEEKVQLLNKAIYYNELILKVETENKTIQNEICEIIFIMTKLLYEKEGTPDYNQAIPLLTKALLYYPSNPNVHYNLGFCYNRLNRFESAVIHYRIALELIHGQQSKLSKLSKEASQTWVQSLDGLGNVYRSIHNWPAARFYLEYALKTHPDNPNILDQLGVVYTELRRTDLAQQSYEKAIVNYTKTLSGDPNKTLSGIYMNYGHMHAYNGNNKLSIEMYNKSIKYNSTNPLPFQNKLLNYNYLFKNFKDKRIIVTEHQKIQKYFPLQNLYTHLRKTETQTNSVINIGFVSGDFINHPVSYFTNSFLNNFDDTKFKVFCYSQTRVNSSLFSSNITLKFIGGLSTKEASQLIYNDNIHILIDLSGHTAFNRIDIFAAKPSPIQISYIGYPFTTGLQQMDYRITDTFVEHDIQQSQKYYTEKLITLPNCFLCYTPSSDLPELPSYSDEQPYFLNDNMITIACFNRLNKINDSVIRLIQKILENVPNVQFVFKTKALLNYEIKDQFLNKFNEHFLHRIKVLNCTANHTEHLAVYNTVDLSLDTFPYSGTTTSCESLSMGVPVITIKDTKTNFHPHNVTSSILYHSNINSLQSFICYSSDDIVSLLSDLNSHFFYNLKPTIRKQFLNSPICNAQQHTKDLESLFLSLNSKLKYI